MTKSYPEGVPPEWFMEAEDAEVYLKPNRGFAYLASPYSHPLTDVVHKRYLATLHATAYLLKRKVWTYSPIVHCHELAFAHDLPLDFDFWMDYNFAMLRKADNVIILGLEGWGTSKGVNAEIQEAQRLGLKIKILERRKRDYTFRVYGVPLDASPNP
jgi:hypothetical protein